MQNFKKFHEKDPEDYFNGIKTKFNKKYCGTIHNYTLQDYDNFPDELKKKINLIFIYRNPITRIESIYQHYLKYTHSIKLNEDMLNFFNQIDRKMGICKYLDELFNYNKEDLNFKKFVTSTGVVASSTGTFQQSLKRNIKCFSIEEMNLAEKRNEFMQIITGKKNIDDCFIKKPLNSHRKKKLNPFQQFSSWTLIQKEIFKFIHKEYFNFYKEKKIDIIFI